MDDSVTQERAEVTKSAEDVDKSEEEVYEVIDPAPENTSKINLKQV